MDNNQYLPTIGLEIHVQLKTNSKMFCSCANTSWKIGVEELLPNSHICPICWPARHAAVYQYGGNQDGY